jgi:soluble lytic murein transglycosylase-like protein
MNAGIPESVRAVRARIAEIKASFGQQASAPNGLSFAVCLRRACAPAKPDDPEIAAAIADSANRCAVDPDLLRAVIQAESGYNRFAVSPKGAQGLMQLMPGTAAALGVTDAFDVRQNIAGGAAYLRQQLDRFGSLDLALAAYNAGPAAVSRHNGIPPFPETQNYVARVMASYAAARAQE